jgi:predicted DNA-binding protein
LNADYGIALENGMYYRADMTTISLKLPEGLLTRLEEESRSRRTTKSHVVRECLEKGLVEVPARDQVSCYDLAQDLAGSVKGLPRDLATHPRHMEGFGQ